MAQRSQASRDAHALIAQGQMNRRAVLPSDRAAIVGYLMATDAHLGAFTRRRRSQHSLEGCVRLAFADGA
jgi:hypothetical protein